MPKIWIRMAAIPAAVFAVLIGSALSEVSSAEDLPWQTERSPDRLTPDDRPLIVTPHRRENPLPPDEAYTEPRRTDPVPDYRSAPRYSGRYDPPDVQRREGGYRPYNAPPPAYNDRRGNNNYGRYNDGRRYDDRSAQPYNGREFGPPSENTDTYSDREIFGAGHRFFGSISKGLAKIIEYSFSREGRPNGYILGEDAGGAFVAGLRYGEGWLYTKNAGRRKVYWQGPSIGYDFGAEGSKTMILVYNLNYPGEIYSRFTGVSGSAYFVGGVGITFQKNNNVLLAPIRAGVGLRLGANVGYLKYTRRPTWNPF